MIKIMYGEEPYKVLLFKNKLKEGITVPDFNILLTEKWGEEEEDFAFAYPMMDAKKLIIVDLDDIKLLNTPAFENYIENPCNTCDVLIYVRKVDARTSIFKKLKQKNFLYECVKYTDKELSLLVMKSLESLGASITDEALKEFLVRKNYMMEGVNFYNLLSDLQTMISVDKVVTLDMVKTYVKANEEGNRFTIINHILSKNGDLLLKEISLTPKGDEIAILSLLLREYRIGYKAKYFDSKEMNVYKVVLKDLSTKELINGLEVLTQSIRNIKTGLDATLEYKRALSLLLQE